MKNSVLVVGRIIVHASEWIKLPTTNTELTETKQLLQTKYKIPTAIGVVDCTHIGIQITKTSWRWINRKDIHTLNVQATCDTREMFTSVDHSWNGSVHDSRIWNNLQPALHIGNKGNVVLLGDDIYGIEPCLMNLLRNPTPGEEVNYNKLLKKGRVIIEQCFGQLKRRFPILQYVYCVKLENVQKMIVSYTL